MHGWKETFSVLGERQMSIVFFSVQSAAGSTLSLQLWKMLDPPFSGLSVGRHSRRDCRPAVRTGMKWQRLAGTCPWCSLVIVQVMPCERENTAYIRLVQWLAANVVLAEHNWRRHVASGRARFVLPHAWHAVTVPESTLGVQPVLLTLFGGFMQLNYL